MRTLAIIPAKAKSSRLPGKNMKLLNGKHLYEYTVMAALDSKIFDEVVISTDIKAIMKVDWHVYGVTLLPRPERLADKAVVVDVCLHVLEEVKGSFDAFCLLLPTAPLRLAEDIIESYKLFCEEGYEGVIGGTKFFQPWWQSLESCRGKNWWLTYPDLYEGEEPKNLKRMTDNGALYWITVSTFLEQKTFFPIDLGIYEMPFERSIDINTEVDFKLAEFFSRKENMK